MNLNLRLAGTLVIITALTLGTSACGKKGAPPPRPPVVVKLATAVKVTLDVAVALAVLTEMNISEVLPLHSGKKGQKTARY